MDTLATPAAGFGSAGGASLSRAGGGLAIGSGYDSRPYAPGAPAPAGIFFPEEYARNRLDKLFESKGVSAPVAPGAAGPPAGVSVDVLIPKIGEKEAASHERIPESSELEERRRREDEEIQARKYQGGGRGAPSSLAAPF